MPDDERLTGMRALVCGAANGLGEAICRTLARHAASVMAIDEASSDIGVRFGSVANVSARDSALQSAKDAGRIVDAGQHELGGLDAVVCAFDTQPAKPFNDGAALEPALSQRLQRVRWLFDAALPVLKKSPGGRFVVVGLLQSAFGRDVQDLVDEAEARLAELVRALAAESARFGITVNYVQPGAIMTPESRRVFSADRELRDLCIRHSAAQRLGEPLDIARAVLFLASDDATFVSGSGIAVNGGRAA